MVAAIQTVQALLDSPSFAILATGVLTGASAALLGTFLVVRGQAMLSDAISHGVVFGVAVTFLLTGNATGPLQLLGAAGAGLLTVALTEWLARSGKVKRDAATGLVFPALFAAGILLLGLFARDAHVDVHTVLLGEIGFVWLDRVQLFGLLVPRSLLVVFVAFVLNTLYVALFYKELTAAAFDPVLAELQGLRPRMATGGLLALTSVTAVAALDAVGVVLFVAFAITPAVVGRLASQRLPVMLTVALIVAAAAALLGYPLAVVTDLSIGGCMALLTAAPLLVLMPLTGARRRRA
ncbi:MAG: metal ABC transporter permease [Trueperaceae bacterium]|jgi:manganese/zinc/iron transport system permease protein